MDEFNVCIGGKVPSINICLFWKPACQLWNSVHCNKMFYLFDPAVIYAAHKPEQDSCHQFFNFIFHQLYLNYYDNMIFLWRFLEIDRLPLTRGNKLEFLISFLTIVATQYLLYPISFNNLRGQVIFISSIRSLFSVKISFNSS